MNSIKYLSGVIKGAFGGIMIAVGVLSAVGYTENTNDEFLVTALVIVGAVAGIVTEMSGINKYAECAVTVGLFVISICFGTEPLMYFASGAVMYMGCVFALPEEDTAVDAFTGIGAAVGFLSAVTAVL